MIFINVTVGDAGDEPLPDAGTVPELQERVASRLPSVEIPYDRDSGCVRRPDGKMGAVDSFFLNDMGAHVLVES